jgi:hypothetical protein
MRILIKIPSRQRSEQLLRVTGEWIKRLSGLHECVFLFTLDIDDPSVVVTAARLKDLFASQAQLRAWGAADELSGHRAMCETRIGPAGRTKVQACNADIDWMRGQMMRYWGVAPDVIVLSSDDMVPLVDHIDDVIAHDMTVCAPDLDGALWYNDGYRGEALCTLPVMGATYYDRFGYIYHPSYKSLWCDNEYTDVGKALGKLPYIDTCILKHQHPLNDREHVLDDALYQRNAKPWVEDKANYIKRKGASAPRPDTAETPAPPPALSILICTVEARARSFESLRVELHRQCCLLPDPSRVEVLWATDQGQTRGGMTVGEKRNKLLHLATGDYICFVDDDDWIAEDYVKSLVGAVGADCVTFLGKMSVNGTAAGNFDFDMTFEHYATHGFNYMRTPNHLCPIRRDIALKVGFKTMTNREDSDYAVRVKPLLKTQVKINRVLYYYRYAPDSSETQRGYVPLSAAGVPVGKAPEERPRVVCAF